MPIIDVHLWFPLVGVLSAACVPAISVDGIDDSALEEGESRTVELRYLRFDNSGLSMTLTKADLLQRFPEKVLRETWLLDVPLEPLITNALRVLAETSEVDVYSVFDPPARNMWKLLNLTPANAVLSGTSLEGVLGLSETLGGFSTPQVLSDLFAIPTNQLLITGDIAASIITDNVVSTHPNAQRRFGPVTHDNPTGEYSVAHGSMPVSLWDLVTDFRELQITFGPTYDRDLLHPGFIKSASPLVVATDDFAMIVRFSLNTLPYKGVDMTGVAVASVNSTASQIDHVVDRSSPDWMEIEGLTPRLVFDELEISIEEVDDFVPGSTNTQPINYGDSPVWEMPLWQFERIIVDIARRIADGLTPHCTAYPLPGDVEMPLEAIRVCLGDNDYLDDGDEPNAWVSLIVNESIILEDPPPPPSYVWDVLLEIAQVRLHDGGIPEGEADVAFKLRDVPLGITAEDLASQIRKNIQDYPAMLAAIAGLFNENSEGEADFYYYVAGSEERGDLQGDWLFFISADDIKIDSQGNDTRSYDDYKNPGFFKDPEGKVRLSDDKPAVGGDTTHQKLKIITGDVFYAEDDNGKMFKIEVNDKPDRHKVSLTLTRIH